MHILICYNYKIVLLIFFAANIIKEKDMRKSA